MTDLTALQKIVERVAAHATSLQKRVAWEAAHIGDNDNELGNLVATIHDTARAGSFLYSLLGDMDDELRRLCEIERELRKQAKHD